MAGLMGVRVEHGDCREVLARLAADGAAVDAVVTDPPYHLTSIVKRFGKAGSAAPKSNGATGVYKRAASGFMGKTWDGGGVAFEAATWERVFAMMKPGAHLLAFGGTRTYHRMVVAIEDAGFEIRDQIGWLYGSGFPKSHDVSKAIDKTRTEDVEAVRVVCRFVRAAMDAKQLKSRDLVEYFGGCHSRLIDHWAARDTDSQPSLPTWEQWLGLKEVLDFGDPMDAEVWRLNGRKGSPGDAYQKAKIIGVVEGQLPGLGGERFTANDRFIRAPSEAARQWRGWGTALKPAWEPIVVARKPLVGTVAANVLAHGTGALNIDGCRVGTTKRVPGGISQQKPNAKVYGKYGIETGKESGHNPNVGRWPANVVHDGSDEVLAAFAKHGELTSGRLQTHHKRSGKSQIGTFEIRDRTGEQCDFGGDSGTAARFFYSAKASKAERLDSKHPTVKPLALMRWLVRLVTPPKGVVLDPFAGSGTTGMAAMAEGMEAILIEAEEDSVADIRRRIAHVEGSDTPLFTEAAP